MKHRRISTQRKSTISISSRRSVRSLCWLARYSIVTSTIAANWRVMSVSRRARSRAEMWRMTRLALVGCTEAEIATITGHSLLDVRSILDAHYLHRDPELARAAIHKLEMG